MYKYDQICIVNVNLRVLDHLRGNPLVNHMLLSLVINDEQLLPIKSL